MNLIHDSAIISKYSRIGKNVSIGAYVVIHDNVEIHDDVIIEPFCFIGVEPNSRAKKCSSDSLTIHTKTIIKSHSTLYQASNIGENCFIGHSVIIRENSDIKKNVQIGNNSEIQGDLLINHDTKLQSNVFVGKFSKIGRFVWLLPGVYLLNDKIPPSYNLSGPSVDDFSVIGANSKILPNVNVAFSTIVGSNSLITSDTNKLSLYYGNPAKLISTIDEFNKKKDSIFYPWHLRFNKNYNLKELRKIYEENLTKAD